MAITDYNFWDGLSIQGYVPTSARGRVTGTASGVDSAYNSYRVVGFSNSQAEYWYAHAKRRLTVGLCLEFTG
jgi:hypothetical protein